MPSIQADQFSKCDLLEVGAMTKKCQEYLESFSFDKAIAETGYGRFHYKLFAVCALCILCVGFQNGLTSYIFSAAQCDLNLLSQDLGLLNVSFLLGGTISAFLWGMIADVNGRKNVLIVTIFLDSIVTIISSFMLSFVGLMICRFFNGILIGCPGSITFTYLAEFHSPKQRAKSVCYSGVAFIAAWVLLPILSYLILPLDFKFEILNIPYVPWRLFLTIIALPEILAGLCLLQLPESPRFLQDKNHGDQALEVLLSMYCQNTAKESFSFPVKKLLSDSPKKTDDILLTIYHNKVFRLFYDMIQQLKKLFASDIRQKTFLSSGIMFCNMFGYFGLGLWLPEFFIQFEEHYRLYPNESITLSDLTFSKYENITENCLNTFDVNTFRNTLIVASSALLCNVLAGWLTGKMSVKCLALLTMLFGSISSFSIYYIRSALGTLMVSSIFQAAMATGNMVVGGMIVEQFPTTVGAIALGMAVCMGRIGAIVNNLLFSMLLGTYTAIAIFTVTGVLLLGSVLCALVPSNESVKEKNSTITNNQVTINIATICKPNDFNVTIQYS